jgi:hypothetical protein
MSENDIANEAGKAMDHIVSILRMKMISKELYMMVSVSEKSSVKYVRHSSRKAGIPMRSLLDRSANLTTVYSHDSEAISVISQDI